jgi:RNA polymerase sigma factor (sigma-70 family)
MTDFAAAAEGHLDDVFAYLVWFTGDRSIAEDLTSETFERALRLWHRYDPRRGSERTWLCQVARTVALDHFRAERRRRRREQAAARFDAPTESDVDGLSPELETALRSLSAAEREIVALRVILDLDGATTAAMLGISATGASTRLHRALDKLEEALRVAA